MPLGNNSGSQNGPLIAAAVVAVLLQLALAPQISVAGGAFNFMVAFACAASLSSDARTAVYIGFFSGLFYDLTSSAPVGLLALLLTLASFAAANATQGLTVGANVESLRIAVVYILVVNLVYGAALFALGSETSLLYALGVHGLVCALLDALACVPFVVYLGARVQTGVFSGRGDSRPARASRPRSKPRPHRSTGGRSGSMYVGGGKHASSKKSGLGSGGRSRGSRYKGLK